MMPTCMCTEFWLLFFHSDKQRLRHCAIQFWKDDRGSHWEGLHRYHSLPHSTLTVGCFSKGYAISFIRQFHMLEVKYLLQNFDDKLSDIIGEFPGFMISILSMVTFSMFCSSLLLAKSVLLGTWLVRLQRTSNITKVCRFSVLMWVLENCCFRLYMCCYLIGWPYVRISWTGKTTYGKAALNWSKCYDNLDLWVPICWQDIIYIQNYNSQCGCTTLCCHHEISICWLYLL